MSVISINYEEPNQLAYESVEISDGKGNRNKFDSGDFIKDWFQAIRLWISEDQQTGPLMFSSSVDHFQMDGDDYDLLYLNFIDAVPILNNDPNGIHCFVKAGETPTWEEYKNYCIKP